MNQNNGAYITLIILSSLVIISVILVLVFLFLPSQNSSNDNKQLTSDGNNTLNQGQYLYSPNEIYKLTILNNGSLVITNNDITTFDSHTDKGIINGPYKLVLNDHGQFVLYGQRLLRPYFISTPELPLDKGPYKMMVTDDGKICISQINSETCQYYFN